jgi:hypothetical protein
LCVDEGIHDFLERQQMVLDLRVTTLPTAQALEEERVAHRRFVAELAIAVEARRRQQAAAALQAGVGGQNNANAVDLLSQ